MKQLVYTYNDGHSMPGFTTEDIRVPNGDSIAVECGGHTNKERTAPGIEIPKQTNQRGVCSVVHRTDAPSKQYNNKKL